jgi:hypothetical protein
MNPEAEMMEKRLKRLEQSNKKLKFGCIVTFVCAAAFFSIGAEQTTKRSITANEFILLGPDGHIRATLSADSTDARLVFLDNSKKIKGIFAADRLVFSDLSGNARVAIRPESDGGTFTVDGRDGGGVQLSRDSEEVGLYMTHGKGDSLSVSIKKDKNPDEVLLQNGPAIQLFDEQGYQTYLGQAGIPGKSTPHVSSLVMRKEGHDIWSAP